MAFHSSMMSKCPPESFTSIDMYRIPDSIRATFSKDGATVLDLRNGKILRLNFTASLIWQQLSNGETQSQIVNDLSRRFGLAHQVIERDVAGFIGSIEEQKILMLCPER